MVIRESALVREMKDAYKSGGYKVVGFEREHEVWLAIYSGAWMVEIEMENVPRKALGLIAEHAGALPGVDEAYLIRKDDTQDEIAAVAMEHLVSLWKALETKEPRYAKRTDLHWNTLRVWQRTDDMEIILVDPFYMNITETPGNAARIIGNALYIEDLESRAWVFRVEPREGEKVMVDHLSKIQWINT